MRKHHAASTTSLPPWVDIRRAASCYRPNVAATTWRRVGRLSFRRRIGLIAAGSVPFSAFVFVEAVQLSNDLVPAPFLARIAIGVVAAIALELLAVGGVALFYSGLLVSEDRATVRIGRTQLPSEKLDRFQLDVSLKRDVLAIRLGRHEGPVTRLWLRGPSGLLLDDDEVALLLTTLERSSIRPPRSIYDPNDRFTHTNFPGALTKDEAIDLVRHGGDAGYRLPLSG